MIQATGTIPSKNGVGTYTNPIISVGMNSTSKFNPTRCTAHVGEVIEATEHSPAKFNSIEVIGIYEYADINPSFEAVQLFVIAGLSAEFPCVQFEAV